MICLDSEHCHSSRLEGEERRNDSMASFPPTSLSSNEKSRISLSPGINALLRSAKSLTALYDLQEKSPDFVDLRSRLYHEAMLYVSQIGPKNVSLVESLRFIASTYREAMYLSSMPILKRLPSAFKEVGTNAGALDFKHNAVLDRLKHIETRIEKAKNARQQNATGQFFSMLRTTLLGSRTDTQAFEILQASLRDLKQALLYIQEYIQEMRKLVLLVKHLEDNGQWEKVASAYKPGQTPGMVRHRDLTYLEVLGSGIAITHEYESLRNVSNTFMSNLCSIPDRVPTDVKERWFDDIKEAVARGLTTNR